MFLLLQGDIFRFHVSFRGCNHIYFSPSGDISILESDIAPEKPCLGEDLVSLGEDHGQAVSFKEGIPVYPPKKASTNTSSKSIVGK